MPLSADAKEELLQIAQGVLDALSRGDAIEKPDNYSPELEAECGAFVTLHCDGGLRGCIGMITANAPLAVTVSEMAEAAATRDPRFSPVSPEEAELCEIEISVMTPPATITEPETVEPGRHGLIITRAGRRGLLLPQVATEQDWDRETFLRHTCMKAGLPPETWKEPDVTIETFEAEVFGQIQDADK
jgi:AmmeMemoRadiSam system protein A